MCRLQNGGHFVSASMCLRGYVHNIAPHKNENIAKFAFW